MAQVTSDARLPRADTEGSPSIIVGQGRIGELRRRLTEHVQRTDARIVRDPAEQRAYAEIACEAYSASLNLPEAERKVRFLQAFAEGMPISIGDDELIVGSQRFTGRPFRQFLTEEQCAGMAYHGNIGHIIVDYGRVLQEGISGLRASIHTMPADSEARRQNGSAFHRALDAFARFIARHGEAARALALFEDRPARQQELIAIADRCDWLAHDAPRTFGEALQMVWFMQIFLHAEGDTSAFSFGRLDQYLWPFLDCDLRGGLTLEAAEELIACFWLKCCEGDESQNLIVGGSDAQGPGENLLSLLCLRVARQLGVWQPSLSVRVGPGSSEEFWHAALELGASGSGQPAFFNDPVVVRALEAAGVPTERARDWGIVGCYEATPQGDTYGITVGGALVLPTSLLEFLRKTNNPGSFDEFYTAFKAHLKMHYAAKIQEYQHIWDELRTHGASPFESLCLTGCLESGLCAEEGGGRINLFGVNILGLGTLIDSLLALKVLVYDTQRIGLDAFVEQLDADFPDGSLLTTCRNLSGKYGTDSDGSNALASDLSQYVADLVLANKLAGGVQPVPAFFRFMADIYMDCQATPDGRKSGERLSYGVGPSELSRASSPTAIANSAAYVAHDRCACGNPLSIALCRQDVAGEAGLRRMRDLVETYFRQGGFHLYFNIVSADQLREAKRNPTAYAHLTVRVSGYSAHFTALDERLQDALIARAELGM